ncbi:MAG: glutathione S-transferase N-terminal domain-containing protein [Nevskia sp.]|nr:glutathione S-transferase N-terminal domain-containing protein [Nevskia sp.]
MDLYFSPLACSMATRIALYEAGADAQYHQVDLKRKVLADGSDFLALNPLGQVPVLRTDSGELLTENPAVLQYAADRHPQGGMAPADEMRRRRLGQWLGFVGSELHKLVYTPLLDSGSNDGARHYARGKATARFALLDRHLDGHEFLLPDFSVGDAYLVTVLNWSGAVGLELAEWPALQAYRRRVLQRPGVARAVAEETALYAQAQEQARGAAQ